MLYKYLLCEPIKQYISNEQKKPLMPVKMMKATYEFFCKHMFAVELEVIILLCLCFCGQIVVSEVIKQIFFQNQESDKEMSFGFTLGLCILFLIIAYYCKSVRIGGWKSSETKISLLIAILSSLLIVTLFFGFKEFIDFDF